MELITRVQARIKRGLDQRYGKHSKVVTLTPPGTPRGRVLLSHLIEPFLLRPGESLPNRHTFMWDVTEMVRTFLDEGYAVHAISYLNHSFVPRGTYDFFLDTRFNYDRLAPLLHPECVKILIAETSHALFQNAAESDRLLALYRRRGAGLRARRCENLTRAADDADYIILYGNEVTRSTYRRDQNSIYLVPITTTIQCDWPEQKDFDACRRRYLWFGSGGMVHKGLDLVLEAFAGMPDHELVVCGPVERETDFAQAYRRELYETPNIQTWGTWIDTDSTEFRDLLARCIGLVFMSCSEGQAGTVSEAMNAGLIPVVSRESGHSVQAFGTVLDDCSVDAIREAVRRVSRLPAEELRSRSRAAWEHARANHSRDRLSQEFRRAMRQVVASSCSQKARLAPAGDLSTVAGI